MEALCTKRFRATPGMLLPRSCWGAKCTCPI
nr:MAG TPA: hypothetical protein [Caudoviricetes sp.]DAY80977.1 MAG TPA: hypothetical protein [Caudoviricetes sp.]